MQCQSALFAFVIDWLTGLRCISVYLISISLWVSVSLLISLSLLISILMTISLISILDLFNRLSVGMLIWSWCLSYHWSLRIMSIVLTMVTLVNSLLLNWMMRFPNFMMVGFLLDNNMLDIFNNAVIMVSLDIVVTIVFYFVMVFRFGDMINVLGNNCLCVMDFLFSLVVSVLIMVFGFPLLMSVFVLMLGLMLIMVMHFLYWSVFKFVIICVFCFYNS